MNLCKSAFVSKYLAIVALFIGHAFAKEDQANYRFTVSWDYWFGESNIEPDPWNEMEVRVNGRSIGSRESAFRFLEYLPVKRGERIKLDQPRRPAIDGIAPGHDESQFIQRWIEKGALVDWYEGGKKFEVHTVTWEGSIKEDLKFVQDMDELTWIVDGKKVGNGKALLPFIEAWREKKDLVIQIAVPVECRPKFFTARLGYFQILDCMGDGRNIRVYRIQPFRQQLTNPQSNPSTERKEAKNDGFVPRIPGLDAMEAPDK